jgi:hypothetical protein
VSGTTASNIYQVLSTGGTFIAANGKTFINNNADSVSFGNGYSRSGYDIYYDGYNIHFRTGTGPTERTRITYGGYFGIGTTSPNNPLHVYNTGSSWL